ncbi:MAG: penicillin-binding protein 2 [Patescibacteria group bacterium]
MKWRFFIIIFPFVIAYFFLITNLYNIQLNKSDYYLARAAFQLNAAGNLEPNRGNIYFTDKNNNLIQAVLNKNYDMIFAVPKEIQQGSEGPEGLEKLALIVNLSVEEIGKKLNKKNDLYELLVQKAAPEQVKQIQELISRGFKGVYVTKQKLRFYPYNNLASHLLGFVSLAGDSEVSKYGNSQIGRYGVELQFNSVLTGEKGKIDGQNLVLTIDRDIQSQSEEVLKKLISDWKAEGGTVIVQEPSSGKILAMANFPNFDPNNYSGFEIKSFLNPAVQSVYESGSVFKIMTIAAGIDSGKIFPETTYVDKGTVTLNNRTIHNWWNKIYGKATMTEVLENSINTGSVFAEQKIGHETFYQYLTKFGFNELTKINLPGEVKSNIRNLVKGRDIHYATASFGQGISVTPIALINAFSAVANGGVLMKPLILADEKPQMIRRVISPETSKKLTQMMISTVKKNKVADIANYSIAGKSGTAYIPDFKSGGYTDEVINTFVGFAPAISPKFTILIKLDKPVDAPFATVAVGPAFWDLTQFILNYYNIPPDNLAISQ